MLTTKQFMEKIGKLNLTAELDKEHERITVYKRGFPNFNCLLSCRHIWRKCQSNQWHC